MLSFANPRQWSPRAQARWSVCLLIAALAIGAGEWMARHNAVLAREDAGEGQLQVTRNMAERLSQDMAARVRDAQLLSELEVVRQMDNPTAMRDALERLKSTLDAYAWIGVTDRAGHVVAATGDVLLGQSLADRPMFQNGLKGPWTGDVREAAVPDAPAPSSTSDAAKVVDLAVPIQGPASGVQGVLAMHLNWQWADQLRQSVLRQGGRAHSLQLAIANASGAMLLPIDTRDPDTALAPARLAALGERWGLATWSDDREAITSVAQSRPLGDYAGSGWRVVARDVQAAARTSVQATRREAYATALGAGALAALIACWVIGRIIAPVERVASPLRQHPLAPGPGGARPQRRNDVPQIATVTRVQANKGGEDAPAAPPDQTHVDRLTGLWNQSHLPDVTGSLQTALADGASETCVLCMDLDGFKQVNDRYGHGAGDEVLVQAARRLRQAARQGDAVFRLGGDEFLVLMTCPLGEAAGLARSIAGRVLAELQRPMSYRTLSNLRISASVGGAVWPSQGESLADAISHANEALQAAKQSGRGMFRLYAGLPAPAAKGTSPRLRA